MKACLWGNKVGGSDVDIGSGKHLGKTSDPQFVGRRIKFENATFAINQAKHEVGGKARWIDQTRLATPNIKPRHTNPFPSTREKKAWRSAVYFFLWSSRKCSTPPF